MAFTPEDGTGLTGANAFITTTFATGYFAEEGNADWAALTSTQMEQAIVKATRYMSKRFGTRLKGQISSSTQGVEFPRDYLYDERGVLIEGVPTAWGQACAIYALASTTNPLIPEVIYPVADGAPVPFGKVQRKLERVGPVTEETYYATSGANASKVSSGSSLVDNDRMVQYPEADLLVAPFLRRTGGTTR